MYKQKHLKALGIYCNKTWSKMLTFSVHLFKTRPQTVLNTQSGGGGNTYYGSLVYSPKWSCNMEALKNLHACILVCQSQ
jgi:hypothetical protein